MHKIAKKIWWKLHEVSGYRFARFTKLELELLRKSQNHIGYTDFDHLLFMACFNEVARRHGIGFLVLQTGSIYAYTIDPKQTKLLKRIEDKTGAMMP